MRRIQKENKLLLILISVALAMVVGIYFVHRRDNSANEDMSTVSSNQTTQQEERSTEPLAEDTDEENKKEGVSSSVAEQKRIMKTTNQQTLHNRNRKKHNWDQLNQQIKEDVSALAYKQTNDQQQKDPSLRLRSGQARRQNKGVGQGKRSNSSNSRTHQTAQSSTKTEKTPPQRVPTKAELDAERSKLCSKLRQIEELFR